MPKEKRCRDNPQIKFGGLVVFAEVLEAAERLDRDSQAELVAILACRLAERGRDHVVLSVAEARREFAAGQFEAMTSADIVREATL